MMNQESIDRKIMTDLDTLSDKMDACERLVLADPESELEATRSFLSACAPRMVELVEAAATGCLSEHVLMRCLECNDRLIRLLNELDASKAPPPTAAAVSAADDDLFTSDLLMEGTKPDIFANSEKPPATVQPTKSEDEFDDFFSTRTESIAKEGNDPFASPSN
jgi:hypothetical protein